MGRSRTCRFALLGLSLILPVASLTFAQVPAVQQESVLNVIPSDALAAVAVRDLKELNEKVISVGQELGMPIGPGTMVGDPLLMLKGMLGVGEGLDDKGPVALVLLKTDELNAEALSRNVVLLVPCTDAKAFLEQFAAAAAPPGQEAPAAEEGAATKPGEAELPKDVVKVSLMGKPSYGMAKGKFAVLAPEPGAIKSYMQSKGSMRSALSPDRMALVEKKIDLFVWVNVAGAGPGLRDTIKSSLMGIMLMASMSDPAIANQVQPWIQNVEKFLDQTASLQLGLTVAKAGVDLDLYMQARPDTDMAKAIAKQKASETSLLVDLPAEKFILALGGTSNTSPEDVKQGMTALNGLLDREEVKKACDPEKLAAFKKSLDELVELGVGSEAASLSISRLPDGENGMIGLTFVSTAPHAARKCQESLRALVQTGLEMVTDEDVRKFLGAIAYKPDAEKIGDAQVDQISVDLSKLPDVTEDDIASIKKIVGSEGIVVRIAALDPDHMAVLFGGGPERVKQVAALAKKGEAPLADEASIKAVAPHLPKGKRFFEMYVAADTLLNLINDAAIAAGEKNKPIPVEVPEIAAPLAVVGTIGKDSKQINIYVPMKMIKGVKDVVTAAMAEKMMPTEPAPAEEESDAEEKPAPPEDAGVK